MPNILYRLKKGEDKGSECAACCLKCCICGFWLLEKFIRFLNHNAYTVVAIESINFCPAAGIVSSAIYIIIIIDVIVIYFYLITGLERHGNQCAASGNYK